MHKAILCIGSNVIMARQLIENAVDRLSDNITEIAAMSEIYSVEHPYYNCVAIILTELGERELISRTKEIEVEMGRTQAMKSKSLVPIDIDVVVFDDITLRTSDYSAEYFKHGYSLLDKFIHSDDQLLM